MSSLSLAIAITVVPGSGERGTGFLIANNLLLTCDHCLGKSFERHTKIVLTFPAWNEEDKQREATLIWLDESIDLALLRLDVPVPNTVRGLRLSHRLMRDGETWQSLTYRGGGAPLPLKGTVALAQSGTLHSLDCIKATDDLSGVSGAPIVAADDSVVGVISDQLTAEGKPFGSTLYARGLETLTIPTATTFCSTSLQVQTQIARLKPVQGDLNSDLFYALLAIRNEHMVATTAAIQEFAAQPDRKLRSLELWSLLGSRELLLSFRAADGSRYCDQLKKELTDRGSLRNVSKEHTGAFLKLDIQHEYASVLRGMSAPSALEPVVGTSLKFEEGDETYDFDRNRSMRVFVLLKSSDDDAPFHDLLECVRSSSDVIHRLCISGTRKDVLLDLHLPCGHFFELRALSERLEPFIEHKYNKMTLVAYKHWPPPKQLGAAGSYL